MMESVRHQVEHSGHDETIGFTTTGGRSGGRNGRSNFAVEPRLFPVGLWEGVWNKMKHSGHNDSIGYGAIPGGGDEPICPGTMARVEVRFKPGGGNETLGDLRMGQL